MGRIKQTPRSFRVAASDSESDPSPENVPSPALRRSLDHQNQILLGIATAEFDRILRGDRGPTKIYLEQLVHDKTTDTLVTDNDALPRSTGAANHDQFAFLTMDTSSFHDVELPGRAIYVPRLQYRNGDIVPCNRRLLRVCSCLFVETSPKLFSNVLRCVANQFIQEL